MKRHLANLIVAFFILLGIAIIGMLILPHLPTNPTPCFGKAKDGHLRWHALSDCAHP